MQTHPSVSVTSDAQDVLGSPCIDAVAVITPVWTHFEVAKAALENGKHVLWRSRSRQLWLRPKN